MTTNVELDLKSLTALLEITYPRFIVDLKEEIEQSFDNLEAIHLILERQCKCDEERQCKCDDDLQCHLCSSESGCLILCGIMHLSLGKVGDAIKKIEKANQHFRREDETWNYIIGLALAGNAYEKDGKDHKAFSEYEKAHGVIKNDYLLMHEKDYIETAIQLEKKLQEKLAEINPYLKKTVQTNQSRAADTRYGELVILVQGDRSVADRLINYEREQRPQSNIEDWIDRAITRLLQHRRA